MFKPALSIYDVIPQEKEEKRKEKLTFKNIAYKLITQRQNVDKDAIILVSGDRGNGKSTWALKLLDAIDYWKNNKDSPETYDPNWSWSWDTNYAKTRGEAIKKLNEKILPSKSILIADEGGDIALSGNAMEKEQRDLQQIMFKSREQQLITVILIPDVFKLDKTITNMAKMAILVDYRYMNICAFAFIFGRTSTTMNRDKFGFDRMRKYLESKKVQKKYIIPEMNSTMKIMHEGKWRDIPYPKEIFEFYMQQPSFIGMMRFKKAKERLYEAYIKNVKSKTLGNIKDVYISKSKYDKLRYMYQTLLYNIYMRQGLSLSQIERLHIDPITTTRLTTAPTIKKHIELIDIKVNR